MQKTTQILSALLISVFFISCGGNKEIKSDQKKELKTGQDTKIKKGQAYGGGIVFYVDTTGKHGLIAAKNDQGFAAWSTKKCNVKETTAGFGTGKQNTTAILKISQNALAALMCDTLTLNGFNDWYLPSKKELDSIYINLKGEKNIGNFNNGNYWSSTEYDESYSWSKFFNNGTDGINSKFNGAYVRAIRAF